MLSPVSGCEGCEQCSVDSQECLELGPLKGRSLMQREQEMSRERGKCVHMFSSSFVKSKEMTKRG